MLSDPKVMKYISDIKTEEGTIKWICIAQKSYQEKGYGPWAVILKDSAN
jgi:RimJ/RimL family protein N-acetyltransferase